MMVSCVLARALAGATALAEPPEAATATVAGANSFDVKLRNRIGIVQDLRGATRRSFFGM
jgi:hypothetical protein